MSSFCYPIESYMGLTQLYSLSIDESPELTRLIGQARGMKQLPFGKKFAQIREMVQKAMKNAYEGAFAATSSEAEKEACKQIVFRTSPLSNALQQQRGCCRFQATLFFILGYEAELGDAHFIQTYPIGSNVSTCYNEVITLNPPRRHIVSIFLDTLSSSEHDYTKGTKIFVESVQNAEPSLSYKKVKDVFQLYISPCGHSTEEYGNEVIIYSGANKTQKSFFDTYTVLALVAVAAVGIWNVTHSSK